MVKRVQSYRAWKPIENALAFNVEGGKYTFILHPRDSRVQVERYGEEWIWIEVGSKALAALICEASEAFERLDEITDALEQKL